MSGTDNLRTPSTAEAREIGRKGGIASGKARRERKLIRETLETILRMKYRGGDMVSLEDLEAIADAKGANLSVQDIICIKMTERAMKGDVRAAEYIRDTAGQKPTEVVSVLEPPVIVDDIPQGTGQS